MAVENQRKPRGLDLGNAPKIPPPGRDFFLCHAAAALLTRDPPLCRIYNSSTQGSSNVVFVSGSNPPCNKKEDGPMGESEAATRPSGVVATFPDDVSSSSCFAPIFVQQATFPSATFKRQVSLWGINPNPPSYPVGPSPAH